MSWRMPLRKPRRLISEDNYANTNSGGELCQEETEQDHPVAVAREQEEALVEAGAGWEVHKLELAPVETVFAPVVVP